MALYHSVALSHRALIAVGGEERKTFLQGLVSNDVTKITANSVIYSAFLTPQGKFLHDFFTGEKNGLLLLEAETTRRDDLMKRLSTYRLRSKVNIEAFDAWHPYVLFGEGVVAAFDLPQHPGTAREFAGGLLFVDPRLEGIGLRAWLPAGAEAALIAKGAEPAEEIVWEQQRIALGLPDGSRDMTPEKAILLENGFDELHGVDWQKGCYLGQELTARTKYRGLIKKRLMPVSIDGLAPKAGTQITLNGVEAGEMRSHAGSVGLALLRLETLAELNDDVELRAGESTLHPSKPSWMNF